MYFSTAKLGLFVYVLTIFISVHWLASLWAVVIFLNMVHLFWVFFPNKVHSILNWNQMLTLPKQVPLWQVHKRLLNENNQESLIQLQCVSDTLYNIIWFCYDFGFTIFITTSFFLKFKKVIFFSFAIFGI